MTRITPAGDDATAVVENRIVEIEQNRLWKGSHQDTGRTPILISISKGILMYWTIDYQRVLGVLERDVDDLRNFSPRGEPRLTCLILATEDSAFVLRK